MQRSRTCAILGIVLALWGLAADSGRARAAAQQDRFICRARQLTFEGRRAGEGYFSPDGRKVIFQSERYQDNPFFQIYIMDLLSGDTRLVSPGLGLTTCAYFRPGTDEILFGSTHLDTQAREKQRREYEERGSRTSGHTPFVYDEYFDIFSSDQQGRNVRRLTDAPGYDAEAAYSPDGKLIVFSSQRDAYPLEKLGEKDRAMWEKDRSYFGELYVMNADGSGQRRLTNWPGYDGGPFFAAENDRVIWRHFDESGTVADIYTMKIDGSEQRRLTDFKSMSWAPYMHPSREYAIFASNKLGFDNFELFIVDAAGEKEPVRITYTKGFDGLPVFSPDGKALAWTSTRTVLELRTGQLFIADWDHRAALHAIKAAPPRGTPEPEPTLDPPLTRWPESRTPKGKAGFEPGITQDDLFEDVTYLAADDLAGRMTGTEGARKASEYIASRFKEAGLEPAGDGGTYYQEFTFPAGVEVVPEKNRLAVSAAGGGEPRVMQLDKDYRPLSFTADGTAKGDVVFAGYGIVLPEESGKQKCDSYAGRDVKNKVVLVLDDVPADLPTDERIRWMLYSSPRYKAMQAAKRGAAGFLLVIGPNTPGSGSLIPVRRTDTDAGIVAASVTTETAQQLLGETAPKLAELQKMLDGGSIPPQLGELKPASQVDLTAYLARKQGTCRNVVGLLPPVGEGGIAGEYVLIGAHYDHIGRGEGGGSRASSGEEGQIHNGADDNASGTATVLELAAQIADARKKGAGGSPQRGLIFAAWSGEEIGVIGSTYFARHAPCPLGQIAAYINFDMVGRLRDGRLILQGVGSSPGWPRLIEKVNVVEPLALVVQNDPYLPTDTHEFYAAGMPVLAFFTDVHDDYNRPTDDSDTLNYAGMEAVARFALRMITELATGPQRPSYASVQRTTAPAGGAPDRRIYTGTVPDFSAGDVGGMKISGVQGGSPAEKAGLKGGDVIIELAGNKIRGLEDYAVVLRALKPDETVDITVRRGEQEVRLTITPTVRK